MVTTKGKRDEHEGRPSQLSMLRLKQLKLKVNTHPHVGFFDATEADRYSMCLSASCFRHHTKLCRPVE